MYIQPNSTIRTYRNVPLDNTYEQTIRVNSVAERNTWLDTYFNPRVLTHYSYLRENRRIRVEGNYNTYKNVNYLSAINLNHEDKYYYYFVNKVHYINENTVELEIELDYISTWFGEMVLKPCFVERQHHYKDDIGDNLQVEPIDYGETVCKEIRELTDIDRTPTQGGGYCMLFTVNDPIAGGGT